MYRYSAYGLTICAALPLPELQPSSGTDADVVVRFDRLDWSPGDGSNWKSFEVDRDDVYLYWKAVGKFLIRSGKEIIIDPLPDTTDALIRLPLLGSALAVILHQRGVLVLHASAVAIHDCAAVFIGPKGQGKSTMAATLCSRGHQLLADDVTAINIQSIENPIVLPGFPQIKLYPEAAIAALGDNPDCLNRIHPDVEKRARPVDRFIQAALPLKRIYVLAQGPSLKIKSLSPQDALAKLLANSYVAYLLGNGFSRTNTALHLHQCAKLASTLTLSCLERPRSLALLPSVGELVENDLFSDFEAAETA